MKKIAFWFMATTCLFVLPLTGCGGSESQVIEAPEVVEEESAIEGMSDDEYDAAMEKDMNG